MRLYQPGYGIYKRGVLLSYNIANLSGPGDLDPDSRQAASTDVYNVGLHPYTWMGPLLVRVSLVTEVRLYIRDIYKR